MFSMTFTVFALVHTDDHTLAVDIGDLQVYDLGNTQPGRVGGHQDGALLETGDRSEEGGDLLQAENDRQSDRLPGPRKVLVAPGSFERHAVEEAQCADRGAETGGCQLAFLAKMDEPGPDLFGTQQFGRAAKVPGETGDLQQIGCLGVLCQVPDQHVVLHAFAEQCHGGPPGNSGWSARSGTSMLLLVACSPPRCGPAPDTRPHGTPVTRLRFPSHYRFSGLVQWPLCKALHSDPLPSFVSPGLQRPFLKSNGHSLARV